MVGSILKRKRSRWWVLNLKVMLPYGGKTLSEKESAWDKSENQVMEQDKMGDVKEVHSRHLSTRSVLEIFQLQTR